MFDRLQEACQLLAEHPEAGHERPEYKLRLRSYLVSPYLIFYRIVKARVVVVRILHERQDIDEILGRSRKRK